MSNSGEACIKISFLFGAGAEGKNNYDLPSGSEYIEKVFFNKSYRESILNDLAKHFDGLIKEYPDISNNTIKSIIKNRILQDNNDGEFMRKHASKLISYLSKEDLKEILNSNTYVISEATRLKIEKQLSYKRADINKKNKRSELKKVLYGEKGIKNSFISDLCKGTIDYSLANTSSLDEYFHAIADPNKFSKKSFYKVFNYYWVCYFVIVDSIYSSLDDKEKQNFKDFFNEDSKSLDHYEVLENITKFTNVLYEVISVEKTGTYYDYIKNSLGQDKQKSVVLVDVATTNYFKFCEDVFAEGKSAIYLNGKLDLFEIPKILEVREAKDLEGIINEFFPFIFGPSMVKPIVAPVQIEEYRRFKDMLEATNVLCILGYGLNADDNHINAFLHDYMISQKDNYLIIVNTSIEVKDICDKLKLENENIGEERIRIVDFCEFKNENKLVIDEVLKIAKIQEMQKGVEA